MAEPAPEDLKLTVNPRSGSKVHLELSGTVLTLSGHRGGSDWQLQVPIELVSVIQKRHSRLKQIVIPLGILLACAIMCFGAAFIFDFDSAKNADLIRLIGASFVFIVIVAIPISIAMAIFERRTRYVYISVIPMNYHIEFWVSKQNAHQMNEFFESIRARQLSIDERVTPNIFPMTLSNSGYKLFPKFIVFFYISCLPALFLERWNLFFLCVLPIIWYVSKKINYLSQPKEYRRAVRNYLKGNLEKALINLESLLATLPDYMRGLLLMAKIYIEQQECDKALELTNRIQEFDIDLARNVQKYIINCKRINQRKSELPTEQN